MHRVRGPRGIVGPVEKAKNWRGTVKRMFSYMKQQKGALFGTIFFVILSTLLSLIAPYMIGMIIDDYIIPKDISGTITWSLVLAAIYVAIALFTWLQMFLVVRVSLKTIRTIRQDLFNKLQTLSLRFFDRRTDGDLMSRVTNDIETLNQALSQSVIQLFSTVLMVTSVAIVMFFLNWVLAITTLLVIPVMIYATKKIITYSGHFFIQRQRNLGELNGFVEESISGKEVVTLFGKEEKMIEQFSEVNERLRHSASSAETVSGFVGPINNFINNVGLGLIIMIGAVMTVNGYATVGIIAAFVTYSRQFFRPISQLSNLFNMLQAAVAGAERVFEIMDEVPEIIDKKDPIKVETLKGNITFQNVSFQYEEGEPVLKNIQFEARQGETIALVGPTGSGKTTITNLIMRFYDVTSGQILIDGRDIRDYELSSLRKKIGVVLQDTFLFSGTIMENIRYGRLDATDEEVIAAAKLASAHTFITRLPERYDTVLAPGGKNISEGERQLLAIARAFLAKADILILDEATSSIDMNTEIEIQKGMARLMEGRTSFVIAHRLKTIENADQILVIRHGEIIERGTHDELLNKKGFYYGMYENQLQSKHLA